MKLLSMWGVVYIFRCVTTIVSMDFKDFTEGEGVSFTKDALRVRVGVKEKEDPIPLCYCFGFDDADAREEIARTGRSDIPQRISALIKQGMCACATRNPSGACCLGEVTRAIARLMRNGSTIVEK